MLTVSRFNTIYEINSFWNYNRPIKLLLVSKTFSRLFICMWLFRTFYTSYFTKLHWLFHKHFGNKWWTKKYVNVYRYFFSEMPLYLYQELQEKMYQYVFCNMCLSACDYVDDAKDSCVPETLCIGGWSLVKLSRDDFKKKWLPSVW